MTRKTSRALAALGAALILLAAPALAAAEGAPAAAKPADEGAPLSIASTTQGNWGKLGIGVGFVGVGPYLDAKGARQEGLHASLSISVEGKPDAFSQPDVREGEVLLVAGYKVLVEKILPGPKGTVLVRLWAPPAKKSWLSIFGL